VAVVEKLLAAGYTLNPKPYRATSPIRKRTPIGPYRRPVSRVPGGS